ncbi:diguanylate cyclase [uncultured Sphingomonas sp.]|uniref:GGDEF domain-containing protein n=1 Tax=uncultured Sphingomonas sp. TaxID=158754 RepID=UPI0025D7152F|nr:diguanylate cyclase [uncultured Sphingomonas sp.]
MDAAVYALIANSCIAALFVVTYGMVALSYARQRAAVWFMVSYLLGLLTPVCELLVRFTDHVMVFHILGYATFLGALLLMSIGMQAFAGYRPEWRLALMTWVAGMVLRLAILGGTRGTMPYELLFQLPFAVASALVVFSVRRIGQHGPIRAMLAGIFGIICLHFLLKPYLAISLGSGVTVKAYAGSFYAVASQVSTGVLLVAAGLCLMLLVIQKALEETILDAETDPLTGLTNRRGLARIGPRLLEATQTQGHGLYALVLDLDHFKRINDEHGHATGDMVLVAFAHVLRSLTTQDMVAVRMGGEEFALLIPDDVSGAEAMVNRATRLAGAIRIALRPFADRGLPPLTASGGIARFQPGETLDGLIARADQLAYRAKRAGRDRIMQDGGDRASDGAIDYWRERAQFATG